MAFCKIDYLFAMGERWQNILKRNQNYSNGLI